MPPAASEKKNGQPIRPAQVPLPPLAAMSDFTLLRAFPTIHSKLTIRTRILLVALLSVVGFIALTAISIHAVRQQMIEDRLTKIRNLTEVGRGILAWQYRRQQRGEIDEGTARQTALEQLRSLRYGRNEYFFVDDFNCVSVLLPILPQWEGRDFSNEVDGNGKFFVREQRDAALAGGGTVYYQFPKHDGRENVDKAAHILPFEPWQWLIGTGVYLDDVDQEIREILGRLMLGLCAVLVVSGFLVALISRSITRPLEKLTRIIHRLTERDYTVAITDKERSDEIGDIARALEIFKHTGREFEILQRELREKEAAAAAERAAWLEQQRENAIRLEQTSRLITVGEMATSLAHELNQPLATITNYCRGCVSLLEQEHADPQLLLEPMRKASEQALRASKIITRIRTYLKRSQPILDPVDLGEIIATTTGLALAEAQRHRVELRVEVPRDLPPIRADRIMLEQLMLNLARNGIDAMRETPGPRQLRITSRRIADGVETEVADQGHGIALADHEHIFHPFFTTKQDGMGMGLNICRSIIEFHGGRLWVTDAPEGGAIFHFTLPLTGNSDEANGE